MKSATPNRPSDFAVAQYAIYNVFDDAPYTTKNLVAKIPAGVLLSDYHAWEIYYEGVAKETREKTWPEDFTVKDAFLNDRPNRGHAAKYKDEKDVWRYRKAEGHKNQYAAPAVQTDSYGQYATPAVHSNLYGTPAGQNSSYTSDVKQSSTGRSRKLRDNSDSKDRRQTLYDEPLDLEHSISLSFGHSQDFEHRAIQDVEHSISSSFEDSQSFEHSQSFGHPTTHATQSFGIKRSSSQESSQELRGIEMSKNNWHMEETPHNPYVDHFDALVESSPKLSELGRQLDSTLPKEKFLIISRYEVLSWLVTRWLRKKRHISALIFLSRDSKNLGHRMKPDADHAMAAFLAAILPQSLRSFAVSGDVTLGSRIFLALSKHHHHLTSLDLRKIPSGDMIALNLLRECTKVIQLRLSECSKTFTALHSEHKRIFREVRAWLCACTRLKRLEIDHVFDVSSLLARPLSGNYPDLSSCLWTQIQTYAQLGTLLTESRSNGTTRDIESFPPPTKG